jgi:pyruvate dehydrogenase (quinone)
VQIDIDAARIGLRYPADVGLVGECGRVLQALLPLINRKEDRGFLEHAQEGMKQWNSLLEERGTRQDKPMKPQVVTHTLNKLLSNDAIIACDCGTVTTWTARYIQMRGEMKFSASGSLATMGNGLPYGVAAAVAFPGRQVICLCGDGGFTMMMMELATIVKYQLPIKVFIIKNNVLGQIKWEQMVFEGNPQFGVQLQPIDFAMYARACGAAGYTLDEAGQAENVIREALAHPGPAVVECVVDANEPPMPGHATLKQSLKFAESLVRGQRDGWDIFKTVLKNKIREVV